jgi:alcohol dehydrogenase
MRAAIYERHGTTDEIVVRAVADPVAGPGEALVRVRAVALNAFDPMMLAGATGLKVPLPMIPCGDYAGEVVALGAGVFAPAIGQRVSGYPILPEVGMMGEVVSGAAAELVAVPAQTLIPIPDAVGFEQAAALPVAYGTAHRMMRVRGAVAHGETVLVLGAAGGVGVACVQMAVAAGARVIAVAGGPDKRAKLEALGAWATIDSAAPLREAVTELVGRPRYGVAEGGVDLLVNFIGGDGFADSLKCLRTNGRALVCGATAGFLAPVDLRYLWSFEQQLIGSNGWSMADQETLLAEVAAGRLEPVIHAVRPLDEIATAIQELIDRRVFGKSVLLP